jgi:hypothetical protein
MRRCDREERQVVAPRPRVRRSLSSCLKRAQFFFRIRAIDQKTASITSWGGGAFDFMRSLTLIRPFTVPEIAQMRPISRQRMQRLAEELAADGRVEFVGVWIRGGQARDGFCRQYCKSQWSENPLCATASFPIAPDGRTGMMPA